MADKQNPKPGPEKPEAAPTPASNVHLCPVCGNPVDPRKTTQALHRKGRLLLFCSSGCLRDFMRKERAEPTT